MRRISQGWLVYWWSGAIVVALAYHVQHRSREWSIIWHAVRHWFRVWTY